MGTVDLNLLRAFVAVAETSSFSLAAERLALPKSSVSRGVRRLEEHLGVTLVHRTTRRVALSTAGEALYERVSGRLHELEGALLELPELTEEPSGLLRITASIDFGATVLADLVTRFVGRFPKVRVELHLSNELVDLVAEGFDVAFRISRRRLKDSSLQAKKLAPLTMQLFAAPSYLEAHGTPRSPSDLDAHHWVGFTPASEVRLTGPGADVKVAVHSRVTGDDMSFVRAAVRAGAGIGVLPTFLVEEDVDKGALVRVLPRWNTPSGDLWLVHPSSRAGKAGLPRKLLAFRDFAQEALAARGLQMP